jgi:DNA-binding MarR family transcriptional regulator
MAKAAARVEAGVELPNRDLIEKAVLFSQAFLRWLDGGPDATPYPRLRVLQSLACNGPAKMRDLAEELGLHARNLTSVADALEAEDLIRRVPHPTDRRATILELTPAGTATVQNAFAPRLLGISGLFDALSDSEKEALLAMLSTLLSSIEAHPAASV